MRSYLLTETEEKLIEAYLNTEPIDDKHTTHMRMLKLRIQDTNIDAEKIINQLRLLMGFKAFVIAEEMEEAGVEDDDAI